SGPAWPARRCPSRRPPRTAAPPCPGPTAPARAAPPRPAQPVPLVKSARLRCLPIFVDQAGEDRASLDVAGDAFGDRWRVRWSLRQGVVRAVSVEVGGVID